MSATLEIHLCAERRSIRVKFDTDAVAAAYVAANGHRFAYFELPDAPLPDDWTTTIAALNPQCEHGLSAQLCAGPGHYPADM